ncbi:MAG: hypothetical protein KAS25_00745 [Dehalococcoidales bacterium]|nr:hypothetical protein [Dehalococcoidales bacterium]
MKQKLLRITLVSCLLITSLFFGGTAYAQEEELPDPGLTPDSPFYFLDTWGKNVGMFFTFGNEAKARKALQYAEERLAETRVMAAKNRVRAMERAANDYDGFMAMVNQRLEATALQDIDISDNISEIVSLATEKHLRVLDRIKDELPEQAHEALTRARTASMNGQINALRALAKGRPERAIDIAADIIENRLERARVRASDNVTADVEEALDYAARIAALEEEMAAIAEEIGIDITAIQQRLAHSTAKRLETLSGVYEQVPEAARQGIANAIENSVRKYERAVEKLTEENALGDIPDAETVMNRLQEEVRARLGIGRADEAAESDNISVQVQVRAENQEQNRERTDAETGNPDTVSANQTREQSQTENQRRSP